jgi:RNA polymerase sigma factor (sigma-70 family)
MKSLEPMRRDERQKVIRAMTDEELVGEIAFGNEEALATLYRRHAAWISGRIWATSASRELSEEVLQDTFLGVWQSAASFRGDGEVGAWLWGIARRRLVSAARRERRHVVIPTLWSLGRGADPAEDSSQVVESTDDACRLRRAVAKLPSDQRIAVEAVHLNGLSVTRAAQVAGVAPGTVKSRLFRARARLREELGGQ